MALAEQRHHVAAARRRNGAGDGGAPVHLQNQVIPVAAPGASGRDLAQNRGRVFAAAVFVGKHDQFRISVGDPALHRALIEVAFSRRAEHRDHPPAALAGVLGEQRQGGTERFRRMRVVDDQPERLAQVHLLQVPGRQPQRGDRAAQLGRTHAALPRHHRCRGHAVLQVEPAARGQRRRRRLTVQMERESQRLAVAPRGVVEAGQAGPRFAVRGAGIGDAEGVHRTGGDGAYLLHQVRRHDRASAAAQGAKQVELGGEIGRRRAVQLQMVVAEAGDDAAVEAHVGQPLAAAGQRPRRRLDHGGAQPGVHHGAQRRVHLHRQRRGDVFGVGHQAGAVIDPYRRDQPSRHLQRAQQVVDHPGGGALAVGPGDPHHVQLAAGMAEETRRGRGQGRHRVGDADPGDAAPIVAQPLAARLAAVHHRHRARRHGAVDEPVAIDVRTRLRDEHRTRARGPAVVADRRDRPIHPPADRVGPQRCHQTRKR